jgi:hypothetical protein
MPRTNYVQLIAEDTSYLALTLLLTTNLRAGFRIKALQESAGWDMF